MKKIDSLYFNEIYFKKKKTFIVQSKREFNEQNSITFDVCETEIKIDYQKYDNLMIYKTRKYGSKEVTILKIK